MNKLLVSFLLAALIAPIAQAASLDSNKPTLLITGSNRGIGLEFVKHYVAEGWNVIATARRPQAAEDLHSIANDYENLVIEQLDVTDHARIEALGAAYSDTAIDLLINNAGVLGGLDQQRLGNLDLETFEQLMAVNVYAPIKMIETFADHVARSEHKKIVSISSGASVLSNPPRSGGVYFYRISKTALNMAMRVAQRDLKDKGVLVIPISPGVVDTDMLRNAYGDSDATRPAGMPNAQSTKTSVDGMTSVIAGIDSSYDGRHMNHDGNVQPW